MRSLAAAVAISLSFLGCGEGRDAPALEAKLALQDEVLTVFGDTSLPNGSVLEIYIWHANAEIVDNAEPNDLLRTIVVQDSRYQMSADIGEWPSGPINASVSFSIGGPTPQPQDVIQAFGPEGTLHLRGPGVSADENGVLFLTDVERLEKP